MKTVTYILRCDPDRDARARSRRPPKVVDLAAWRAEHLTEPDEPRADGRTARRGGRGPARRRWSAADWAELAATLAVAAAFAALAVKILLV